MNKSKKKILLSILINTLLITLLVCIFVLWWPKTNNFKSFKEFEAALSLNNKPEADSKPTFCLYKIIVYLLENGTKGRLRNAINKNPHLIPSIFQDFALSKDPKFAQNCVLDFLLAEYPSEEGSNFEPLDSFIKDAFSIDSKSKKEIPFALAQCLARRCSYSSEKAAVTLFLSFLRIFKDKFNFLICDIVYSRLSECLSHAVLEPTTTSYYLIEAYFIVLLTPFPEFSSICTKTYLNMFRVIYEDMGFYGYLRILFAFSRIKIHELHLFVELNESFFVAYLFHMGSLTLTIKETKDLESFLADNEQYKELFAILLDNRFSKFKRSCTVSQTDKSNSQPTHARGSSQGNLPPYRLEPLDESVFFSKLQTEGFLDILLYYIASNKICPIFFNNFYSYEYRLNKLKEMNPKVQKDPLTPKEYISKHLVSMPNTLQYFIKMTTFSNYCPIVLIGGIGEEVLKIIDSRGLYKVPSVKSEDFQRLYLIAKRYNLRNLLFALLQAAIKNNVDMDNFFPSFIKGFPTEPLTKENWF